MFPLPSYRQETSILVASFVLHSFSLSTTSSRPLSLPPLFLLTGFSLLLLQSLPFPPSLLSSFLWPYSSPSFTHSSIIPISPPSLPLLPYLLPLSQKPHTPTPSSPYSPIVLCCIGGLTTADMGPALCGGWGFITYRTQQQIIQQQYSLVQSWTSYTVFYIKIEPTTISLTEVESPLPSSRNHSRIIMWIQWFPIYTTVYIIYRSKCA